MSEITESTESTQEVEAQVDTPIENMSDDEFQEAFDKMMSSDSSEEAEVETEAEAEETETEAEETEAEETETETETEAEEAEETEVTEETEEAENILEQPIKDSKEEDTEASMLKDIPTNIPLDFDIPVNGTKVKATIDELVEGFKKGINYTKKMQEMAPMRKSLSILSENKIDEETLNTVVDMLSGNSDAAAKLLQKAGIDSLDIDEDKAKEYVPEEHGTDDIDFEIKEAIAEIATDKENYSKVEQEMSTMDENFFNEIVSSPNTIKAFNTAVKSGEWDKVKPEMIKMSMLNGKKQGIDLYKEAYTAVVLREEAAKKSIKSLKSSEKQKTVAPDISSKRKSLSPTSGRTEVKSEIIEDINSLDDEAFAKEFKKMTGRAISDFN